MSYGVTLPLLPQLLSARGISGAAEVARHTGWLTSLYTLALIASAPVWGKIADRRSARRILAVTLMASAVAIAVLPFLQTLTALYVARAAAGVVSAGVLPVVLAAVANGTDPELRPLRFGWVSSATALGFLLGPLVGEGAARAPWVSASLPWLAPVAVAALNAACAGAVCGIRTADARAGNRPHGALRVSRELCLAWAASAVTVMTVTVVEVGVTLLTRESAWPASRSLSLYFGVCSAVMIIVQLWVYPQAQRLWSALRIEETALVALAVGVGSLAWPAPWVPVPSFIMTAAGIGVLIPAMAVRVAAAAPAGCSGIALGWQAAFANLGQAVGAGLTGQLYAAEIAAPFLAATVIVIVFAVGYGGATVTTNTATQPVRSRYGKPRS